MWRRAPTVLGAKATAVVDVPGDENDGVRGLDAAFEGNSMRVVTNPLAGCPVGDACQDLRVALIPHRPGLDAELPTIRFRWSLDMTLYEFVEAPLELFSMDRSPARALGFVHKLIVGARPRILLASALMLRPDDLRVHAPIKPAGAGPACLRVLGAFGQVGVVRVRTERPAHPGRLIGARAAQVPLANSGLGFGRPVRSGVQGRRRLLGRVADSSELALGVRSRRRLAAALVVGGSLLAVAATAGVA